MEGHWVRVHPAAGANLQWKKLMKLLVAKLCVENGKKAKASFS